MHIAGTFFSFGHYEYLNFDIRFHLKTGSKYWKFFRRLLPSVLALFFNGFASYLIYVIRGNLPSFYIKLIFDFRLNDLILSMTNLQCNIIQHRWNLHQKYLCRNLFLPSVLFVSTSAFLGKSDFKEYSFMLS